MKRKTWIIRSRFMVAGEGWKETDTGLPMYTLTEAHHAASREARKLDELYGDSHFWTVDVYNAEDPTAGSAVQLFHGRLI